MEAARQPYKREIGLPSAISVTATEAQLLQSRTIVAAEKKSPLVSRFLVGDSGGGTLCLAVQSSPPSRLSRSHFFARRLRNSPSLHYFSLFTFSSSPKPSPPDYNKGRSKSGSDLVAVSPIVAFESLFL